MPRYWGLLLLVVQMMTTSACVFFHDSHENDLKHSGNADELISWLGRQPREDVAAIPAVKTYLAQHKVFIALTSSPLRVQYLNYVLRTLDLTHVEAIILSLPERYERDGSSYDVPDVVEGFPKLVIHRSAQDWGPLTKLLGAIDYIKAHYQADGERLGNHTLITIDDDTGYPAGMVNEIVKHLVLTPHTLVGAAVQRLDYWTLPREQWPDQSSDELIQGFGGAGYRLGWLDSNELAAVAAEQRRETGNSSCYLADDLVVNYMLAKAGIARRRILSRYYQRSAVIPYPFSFGDDSLSRLPDDPKGGSSQLSQTTALRYRKCLDFMATKYPPSL